ncbi:hypothetical protein ACXET9_08345 [Brachybacterium sp. DNPG3]
MRTTTTAIGRTDVGRTARLAALAATALLVAGCGSSGAADDDTGTSASGGDSSQSDAGGAGDDQGGDDQGSDDQGDDDQGGDDQGDDDDQGSGGDDSDDGSGGGSEVTLPDDWAGTIAVQPFDAGDGIRFFVQQNLYGVGEGLTEMGALDIQGQEYFGGTDVKCSGTAVLDGEAATCIYTGTEYDGPGEGEQLDVTVRLVPTAFGSTALIYSIGSGVDTDFTVPAGAAVVIGDAAGADAASVAKDDLESGVLDAILLSDQADGDLPADLAIDCQILDDGAHALCEVTGTADGAGDGSWYATAQGVSQKQTDSVEYAVALLPQG